MQKPRIRLMNKKTDYSQTGQKICIWKKSIYNIVSHHVLGGFLMNHLLQYKN